MDLDLSMGDSGGAASDSPTANDAGTVQDTPASDVGTESAVEVVESTPSSPETSQEDISTPDTDDKAKSDPTELSEEDLEKLVKDPNTNPRDRKVLEQAWKLAGRRKEERNTLQAEFETYKSQYEGVEAIKPEELTRLRESEDFRLNIGSITAKPDDILKAISTENPRVYKEMLNQVAWNALEKEDGSPDFDNLQAFIDRAAKQFGDTRVDAQDVWQVVRRLASGELDRSDIQGFQTVEEMEAFERQQKMNAEAELRTAMAKQHAEFAEQNVRTQLLRGEQERIRSEFNARVGGLFNSLKLAPVEGEPKWATDFRSSINQELDVFLGMQASNDPDLREAQNILTHLEKSLSGAMPDVIRQEIEGALQSRSYQLRLAKGLDRVFTNAEKHLTQKAFQFGLMMKGHEADAKKKPRPVAKSANQTPDTEALSEEEYGRMNAEQRRDYEAQRLTAAIRASQAQAVPA